MSVYSQFISAGVKSIQTAYISTGVTNGSGEDTRYVDVTVSSVNTAKSVVWYVDNYVGDKATARLTSSTNLRIGKIDTASGAFAGRYYIVEFY